MPKDLFTPPTNCPEPRPGIAARYGGARSLVAVPMRRDNELVGAFIIYRQEVRPFTGKQIELVTNFAAQAVIAIENARLLNELRKDSLQQQTATSEVLKAISHVCRRAASGVRNNAGRIRQQLCEASYATLWLREGDGFRATALHGDLPPAWVEQWRSKALYHPPREPSRSAVHRSASTCPDC